jgi:hypothetical protein
VAVLREVARLRLTHRHKVVVVQGEAGEAEAEEGLAREGAQPQPTARPVAAGGEEAEAEDAGVAGEVVGVVVGVDGVAGLGDHE